VLGMAVPASEADEILAHGTCGFSRVLATRNRLKAQVL
jgi:hypothetical protein